jgi:hypothetical protein
MEETFYYVKNFCEERKFLVKISFQEFNIYIYPFDEKYVKCRRQKCNDLFFYFNLLLILYMADFPLKMKTY